MSYSFVTTKKQVVLNRASFKNLLADCQEQLTDRIDDLPDYSVKAVKEYVDFVLEVIITLEDFKKREQMYTLLSFFLSVKHNDDKYLISVFDRVRNIQQPVVFKVKVYSQWFKTVKNNSFKKILLINSIGLLANEQKINYLTAFLKDIDALLKQLELSSQQLSEVYIQIIKSLQDNPFYKELVRQFVVKFLLIVSDFNKYGNITAQYLLYLIQKGAIDQKVVSVSQAANLRPIQDTIVFKLFSLYLSGDYQAYRLLSQTSSKEISSTGIKVEEYVQKLKVQYVATLAQSHKTISYKEFAEKLDIPQEQVEKYVIYAIQNSIVNASIDEFDQTVTIKQIKSKYFSAAEWPKLLKDLQGLTTKLDKYLA